MVFLAALYRSHFRAQLPVSRPKGQESMPEEPRPETEEKPRPSDVYTTPEKRDRL